MYGYETWSVALREEHGLRVFKNRVLRELVWAQMEEVTGEWIKWRNKERHDLYLSPDIIRVIKSRRRDGLGMWHVWDKRDLHRFLVVKPEGKRTLGRPKLRREDIIETGVIEIQ